MSIGFNGEFGYNVKQYQQMRFAQSSMNAGQKSSSVQNNMDGSVFASQNSTKTHSASNVKFGNIVGTSHKANISGTNNQTTYSTLLSARGSTSYVKPGGSGITAWDMAYEKQVQNQKAKASSANAQNSNAAQTTQSQSGFMETIKSVGEVFSTTNNMIDGVKGLFGKNKSPKSQAAQTAQKDETAVNNASNSKEASKAQTETKEDKNSVKNENKTDKKNITNAEAERNEAVSKENETASQEQTAKTKQQESEQKLQEANQNVQTCQTNLDVAKGEVANAEQALQQAEAAKTSDNPNTAAIEAAKHKLEAAKQKQQDAEQKLEQAKQQQTQAEDALNQANQNLSEANEAHSQARMQSDQTDQNLKSAQNTESTSSTAASDLSQTEQKADQKIQEFEQQENTTSTQTTQDNPAANGVENGAQSDNISNEDMLNSKQDNLIKQRGYSENEQTEIMNNKNAVMNMKPGDTVKCGADTYTMDESGTIHVNDTAAEFSPDQKGAAARNAAESTMRQINSNKRTRAEDALL